MDRLQRTPRGDSARLVVAWLLGLSLAWILWMGTHARGVAAAATHYDDRGSGMLLVSIEPGLTPDDIRLRFAEQGMTVVRVWPAFDLAAVRTGADGSGQGGTLSLATALARTRAMPGVRHVETDGLVQAAAQRLVDRPAAGRRSALETASSAYVRSVIPDDPRYPEQWAMARLGMPQVWSVTQGDPALVVAVIDSGLDREHEDLAPDTLWQNQAELQGAAGTDDDQNGFVDDIHGWDWVDEDPGINDEYGHGTHVSGVLSAQANNGVGIAGMAPGLRILPLRVLDQFGSGYLSDLIDALDYARNQGAAVVNLSLVLRFDSDVLHQAIHRLYADGVLIVAANGNDDGPVYWPAAYPETVAVAATGIEDGRLDFSNWGAETVVAAPGGDILSTYKENGYHLNRGTSMAAAHVSALAALLWSVRPDLDREAILDLMTATAVDVNQDRYPGVDEFVGWGRIDAAAAIEQAAQPLRLDISYGAGLNVAVSQTLRIPLQLVVTDAAGTGVPVAGGIVHFELWGPSDATGVGGAAGKLLALGDLVSDETGYVVLELDMPGEPGFHTLALSTGLREEVLMIEVQDGPLRLSVVPAAGSMPVGDGQIDIVVQARNDAGDLLKTDLPVTLHTSLGTFSDGSQMRSALLVNGMLTETLHAGTVAGSAEVRVETPEQRQRTSIIVRPGGLHRLVGPTSLVGIDRGEGTSVDVHLTLLDRYGNRVWGSHQVNFYALGALFSPASARAVNGEVTATLDLGPWVQKPVPIWATVPGYFVVYRAEVRRLSHHQHLPLLLVEAPASE